MPSARHTFSEQKLIAVLGPTNTGKTHLAIERLCAHSSGLIGFPLRLLAREVYDRVCAIKGPKEVALITGEERIVPDGARWVLATMESMPVDGDYAFVAMDEAQLGADPERGHIFTQRILHARGREETMILGSASLRPMIEALLPDAEIVTRPRFSTLAYGGHKKLSRLPPRSAIVAFSAEEVYATAELLRRFRGGAAVVMGALSPRTRNAQVAMFQSGEVDYLVATDAIGMGLNLDVHHVAFAALRKFDGQRQRRLTISEMAQIAGRAGRHQRDGSFGTLASLSGGRSAEFTPEEIERIENHQVPPLPHLYWRQHDLDYSSLDNLLESLAEKPEHNAQGRNPLRPAPAALDLAILQRLAGDGQIAAEVTSSARLARLWAACSLPDFRQLGADHHARFVAQLWNYLKDGDIPHDYARRKLDEIDNAKGDVGTLSGRLAAIRNWAYIAERPDWLDGRSALGQRARDIEEKLSDALHSALAERFVDRRASLLMRRMTQDSGLLPVTIDDNDVVAVDGEPIGRLEGFHFHVGPDAKLADRKMLLAAAERHIGALLAVRAKALVDDEDKAFTLSDDVLGGICWQGIIIARWQRGGKMLSPSIVLDRSLESLDQQNRDAIMQRLALWVKNAEERDLKTMTALQILSEDEKSSPSMRAIATQLIENGGVVARGPSIHELLGALTDEERQALRSAHVRIGALDLFVPSLNNQRTRKWLQHLLAIWYKKGALPQDPMAGLPAMQAIAEQNPEQSDEKPADIGAPERHLGYRRAGNSWLRVDMAERILRDAHDARQSGDKGGGNKPAKPAKHDKGAKKPMGRIKPLFPLSDHLALSIGLKREDWEKLLRTGGFRKASPQDIAAAAQVEAGAEAEAQIAADTPSETEDAQANITATETVPPAATEVPATPEVDPTEPSKADKSIAAAPSEAEAAKEVPADDARPVLRPSDKKPDNAEQDGAAQSEASDSEDATPEATGPEASVPLASAADAPLEEVILWRWTGLNKQRRRKPEFNRRDGGNRRSSGQNGAQNNGRDNKGGNRRGSAKGRSDAKAGGNNRSAKQGDGRNEGRNGGRNFTAPRSQPVHPEFEKLRALFPQGSASGKKDAKKPNGRNKGKNKGNNKANNKAKVKVDKPAADQASNQAPNQNAANKGDGGAAG